MPKLFLTSETFQYNTVLNFVHILRPVQSTVWVPLIGFSQNIVIDINHCENNNMVAHLIFFLIFGGIIYKHMLFFHHLCYLKWRNQILIVLINLFYNSNILSFQLVHLLFYISESVCKIGMCPRMLGNPSPATQDPFDRYISLLYFDLVSCALIG